MTEATTNLPGDRVPAVLRIENTVEKTRSQLGMLLDALYRVSNVASTPRSLTEGYENTPELIAKASDSSIRILHQIDNLIEDMSRWSSAPSPIEQHYANMVEKSAKLQEAVLLKQQIDTLPHARFNAHLYQNTEGEWGAYLIQGDRALQMGKGQTAQEALNNFDLAFIRGEAPMPPAPKPAAEKKRRARAKPQE